MDSLISDGIILRGEERGNLWAQCHIEAVTVATTKDILEL